MLDKIVSNVKTLLIALFIAVIIRSLFFHPFYIPSSSMEPNLLIGDRIFASKYTYGFSKHSFPFSPPLFKGRIFYSKPKYGDLVIFKTPLDNRTDYIKRLIGFPGDEIQIVDGEIYLNKEKILRKKINKKIKTRCGGANFNEVIAYKETLPNGISYVAVYNKEGSMMNTDNYIVPDNHYFFLGDNRDCSKDSRYLSSVGYVHEDNLIGKARVIFFSNDTVLGSFFKFWNWKNSLRINRFFKKLQ
tara:strand:- start:2236 stop:2967 length:732 start_codon:yes stop_codon:yes gene_type:complete